MKYILLLLCFYSQSITAQTKQQMPTNVYGGNNQFGNNNYQYNSTEPSMTDYHFKMTMEHIHKIERDSNFHHIKRFYIDLTQESNGGKICAQLIEFLKSKGYYFGGQGEVSTYNVLYGALIDLDRRDSAIVITLGRF